MWNQLFQVETPHFVSKTLGLKPSELHMLFLIFKKTRTPSKKEEERYRDQILFNNDTILQRVQINLPEATVNRFIFKQLPQLETH